MMPYSPYARHKSLEEEILCDAKKYMLVKELKMEGMKHSIL